MKKKLTNEHYKQLVKIASQYPDGCITTTKQLSVLLWLSDFDDTPLYLASKDLQKLYSKEINASRIDLNQHLKK